LARVPQHLPAGRPPWDPINGFRVGGITGAFLGGLVTAILGMSVIWLILVGAALGGAIGYVTEKRKRRFPSVGGGDDSGGD